MSTRSKSRSRSRSRSRSHSHSRSRSRSRSPNADYARGRLPRSLIKTNVDTKNESRGRHRFRTFTLQYNADRTGYKFTDDQRDECERILEHWVHAAHPRAITRYLFGHDAAERNSGSGEALLKELVALGRVKAITTLVARSTDAFEIRYTTLKKYADLKAKADREIVQEHHAQIQAAMRDCVEKIKVIDATFDPNAKTRRFNIIASAPLSVCEI